MIDHAPPGFIRGTDLVQRQAGLSAGAALARRAFAQGGFADHHAAHLGHAAGLCVASAGHPPKPQHGKAVAERLHLAELVGNHQDGDLLAFGHAAQKGQHLVRLARGHHRGRLIEDQEALVQIEKLEDLQLLLLARRQVRDLAVQPHPERHPVHERLQRALLGAPVDDARRIGTGHDQIFGRRQAGHQREMLVDHADPLRLRLSGAVQRHAHTIKEDRTRIRAVESP
jgi:hypothetical protein